MTPTLGVVLGLPLAALLVIGCLIWIIYWFREEEFDLAFRGVTLAIAIIVITGLVMWPWKAEYHAYRPIEGTVTSVNSRILPAGEAVEQKFVVTLEGDPHPYGIQDTRASLLKVGDNVKLRCRKVYQWGSTDHGDDCRWG